MYVVIAYCIIGFLKTLVWGLVYRDTVCEKQTTPNEGIICTALFLFCFVWFGFFFFFLSILSFFPHTSFSGTEMKLGVKCCGSSVIPKCIRVEKWPCRFYPLLSVTDCDPDVSQRFMLQWFAKIHSSLKQRAWPWERKKVQSAILSTIILLQMSRATPDPLF